MSRFCITTLITNDHYQYFAPMLVYTAHKAYPKADIVIFVRGEMKDKVKEHCKDAIIHEKVFKGYPKKYTTNALRFLIPAEYFKDYKYVMFVDVDFILLSHPISHYEYYKSVLKKSRQHYAGIKGRDKQIIAGQFFVDQKWFRITQRMRGKYSEKLKKKDVSLRIYDEMMLWIICKESGLRVPRRWRCFESGRPWSFLYRDIHLGDFRYKEKWTKKRKMFTKFLKRSNILRFKRIAKKRGWKRVLKFCTRNTYVRWIMANFEKYLKSI